jgi:hypothetical protein
LSQFSRRAAAVGRGRAVICTSETAKTANRKNGNLNEENVAF